MADDFITDDTVMDNDAFARFYSCDHLGAIVSHIRREQESWVDAYEEMDAFYAPSECYTLVWKQEKVWMRQLLAEYGITNEPMFLGFLEAVCRRTTDKWTFNAGLHHLHPF